MSAEENFKTLGLELPPAPTPLGVYKPFLIDGKHCYVSGHGPLLPDKSLISGRVGMISYGRSKTGCPPGRACHSRHPENKILEALIKSNA